MPSEVRKLDYTRGVKVAEGKTKTIWSTGKPEKGLVIVENRDDVTAFDDPSKTRKFQGKAAGATTTTCRVFELLREAGVPVAYQEQLSETEFLAERVQMLPFEAVARRYAVGGYLKRHPDIPEATPPQRFRHLMTELSLKTTKGHCTLSDGCDHDLGLDPSKGEEDPLLVVGSGQWLLYHTKMPSWQEGALLGTLDPSLLRYNTDKIEQLLRQTFLVLEGAWGMLGYRLIDLKIEVGINPSGQVIADVVDNDSWRLRDPDWRELSKQVFRDQLTAGHEDMGEVEAVYRRVAELTGHFRISRQAIVIWKGSTSDQVNIPDETARIPGVECESIALSGHKGTIGALKRLSELESQYPEGGVHRLRGFKQRPRTNSLGPYPLASDQQSPRH